MRAFSLLVVGSAVSFWATAAYAAGVCEAGSTYHEQYSGCRYLEYCLRRHIAYSDSVPMPGYPDEYAAKWASIWNEYKSALNICSSDYYGYFNLPGPPNSRKPASKQKTSSNTSASQKLQRPVPSNDESTLNQKLLSKAQSEASRDVSLDPWNSSAKEADKAKADESRAPYADGSCASFRPAKPGGISWDDVKIYNLCKFPIQVIVCYYDRADTTKCSDTKTAGKWGTTQTITPGEFAYSVASVSKARWLARYYVCDMRNAEGSKLCLLPKKGKGTVVNGG